MALSYFTTSSDANQQMSLLDVRRDDTDVRDLVFQPTLQLLPMQIDNREKGLRVYDQGKEGACVGFALATVINVCLLQRQKIEDPVFASSPDYKCGWISPQMLYEMGRRYDQWKGQQHSGTSLRGAMKGWHHHGVTTEALWPFPEPDAKPDTEFTLNRAQDALSRPIGAYFRVQDNDVSHMQAAIVEGSAVLASAWIHEGWTKEKLVPADAKDFPRIGPPSTFKALHAFAIVGYSPVGFIVQNSWGMDWGQNGCALLPYDDWMDNRQDVWVARLGPTTLDSKGMPALFLDSFAGGVEGARAQTAASGLAIKPEVLPFLINTGDMGGLSTGGFLQTRETELPSMAERVLTATPLRDGYRHVVLYAHGGLCGEIASTYQAARLWEVCQAQNLCSYFFIWETGWLESPLGRLMSQGDTSGPAAFALGDVLTDIKKAAGDALRKAQVDLGRSLAPVARDGFWSEITGRAQGASTKNGGAKKFMDQLFAAISRTPGDKYKLHLMGHSAGSIYIGWLYEQVIARSLPRNVALATIDFFAPAISISRAQQAFASWPGKPASFKVYQLKPDDEAHDSIGIYPSSLLTYVADCLESPVEPVKLLGLQRDFTGMALATTLAATESTHHGDFTLKGHEIEETFARIAGEASA